MPHQSPSTWKRRSKALAPQRRTQWRSWCDEHADDLAASGVPTTVFSDEDHWVSFLEIGDLRPADFDVRRLSIPQKVALLRVISSWPRHLSTPLAVGLVTDILDVMEHRV